MNDELKMSVSPVCVKEGQKYAYVSFTDGERNAEGRIPECTIIKSSGFSGEEIAQLEDYMRRERTQLKKMAAGINIMTSFLRGDDSE